MVHRLTKAMAAVTATAISFFPVSPAFAQHKADPPTTTPIKHVVIIFQENVSFDHYFGTYPHAFNVRSAHEQPEQGESVPNSSERPGHLR